MTQKMGLLEIKEWRKMRVKKFLALVLSMVMVLSLAVAWAEDEVTVSIADGTGVAYLFLVDLKDVDGDGAVTINDVLAEAHDAGFDGGASAGHGSAMTEYGLSLTKLWGIENGGAYGYYVNGVPAMSLADEVKAGDRVGAFVYSDTTNYSDLYTQFDQAKVSVKTGETVFLTLTGYGYDESWNPVSKPIVGATVTVNGQSADTVTNEQGKAELTFTEAGEYTVSAVCDDQIIVTPICVVTVQ